MRDFQAACERLDLPRPSCTPYLQLLRGAVPDAELLRIDSPGENADVAAALIALGGGPPEPDVHHGEIAYTREYHLGLTRLLDTLGKQRCLNPADDILLMFDKWACHQLFVQHNLPRPPSHIAPRSWAQLRAERPHGRVFLKPLHGSSASGVCALRWTSTRQQLTAPLKVVGNRLINSLHVQTYTEGLERILDPLLRAGMICEQWIPKLTLPDGAVDLRVLVISGEARHTVVRQSRHPMTNLHLGNRRGDLDEIREAIGDAGLLAAWKTAERAAACFPRCLYAGVDILLDNAGRPLVGEINAFGDLLPGLVHREETAYEAIAKACHAQRCVV